MSYDFDAIIPRSGSGSMKYDDLTELYGRDDLLPLWIADMDFATPPFILDAIEERLKHPVLGYGMVPDTLWPAVARWVREHHGWEIKPEWLTYVPGIVPGIAMAVSALTSRGDRVVIQPPVYPPFHNVPAENGREVVFNPLRERSAAEGGGYEMDFGHLEALLADEHTRLFILCNPHNPGGIVWPRPTLERIARLCVKHGVCVISDEIHCDLALFGHRHVPFASVCPEAAACSVTFQAPSKTFNMAGLAFSYAVVPCDKLRGRMLSFLEPNELNHPTILSPLAALAAYGQGEPWRREMLAYVEANVRLVEDFCREYMPQLRPWRPQASFLVWLDCRALGLSHEALIDLFVNRARLALNDGASFGPGGEGFMRLNVGAPRSVIRQALEQLRAALA